MYHLMPIIIMIVLNIRNMEIITIILNIIIMIFVHTFPCLKHLTYHIDIKNTANISEVK